jgi:hypothetical protein
MNQRNQQILTKGDHMKNQAKEMTENSKPKRTVRLQTNQIANETGRLTLASELSRDAIKSWVAKAVDLVKGFFKQDDLTFEQWEQLERRHSPHSSHHAQIYYRERR